MTSHLNCHTTTDVKLDILSDVKTGNGISHDTYVRGIAHVSTNRKDNIFRQIRLGQILTYIFEWGQGTCVLTKQTWHWTHSAFG